MKQEKLSDVKLTVVFYLKAHCKIKEFTSMLYLFHMNSTIPELLPLFSTESWSKPHLFSVQNKASFWFYKEGSNIKNHNKCLQRQLKDKKKNLTSWDFECLKASLQDRNFIDSTRYTGKPRKLPTSFLEVITSTYVPVYVQEEFMTFSFIWSK